MIGFRAADRPPLPVDLGHGQGQATLKYFADTDLDKDGVLSEVEFLDLASGQGLVKELAYRSIFSQVDIDGDYTLSVLEFEFSRYLLHEAYLDRRHAEMEEKLPKGFRDEIDGVFADLRARYSGGFSFPEVMRRITSLLSGMGFDLDERDSGESFHDMFGRADVIPDGLLNLNELDYFHFLIRDALILAVVEQKILPKRRDPVDAGALGYDFVRLFDGNGDGGLDVSELLHGLERSFFEGGPGLHVAEANRLRASAKDQFAKADGNSDGLLDYAEVTVLLHLLRLSQSRV